MFERGGYNSDRKFKDNFEDSRRNDFDFEQTTVGSLYFTCFYDLSEFYFF